MLAISLALLIIQAKHISLMGVEVAGVSAGRNLPNHNFDNELQARVDTYKLSIEYPNGEIKRFNLEQIGVEADVSTTNRAIIESQQRASFWQRLQFWQTKKIPLELSVYPAKFNDFYNSEAIRATKQPVDASLSISEGVVNISAGANGEGYMVAGGKKALLRNLSSLPEASMPLKAGVIVPHIQAPQIAPAKKKAEEILNSKIVFTINNRNHTASKADVGTWIEFVPNELDKKVAVEVNGNKVLDYIAEITKSSATYDAQVIFTQPDGTKIALSLGNQSLEGTNKTTVASSLAAGISSGKNYQATLIVKQNGNNAPNYSYDKWLAVDTVTKRMYAYEKTNLVRTFLISAGAPGTPTDKGFHKIYAKYRVQDMRGPNTDGTTYFQPNVEWVSYFYNGEAIHGNYWRPLSYFGNINSSHGCVGVVNSDAQWVYNWAPIGTPVVVYN